MKIILAGGGTAGHFYPLIAIAQALNDIIEEEKLVKAELYFMSVAPYDKKALFDNGIVFKRIFSGKARIYFSLLNFFDAFKIFLGIIKALWEMYRVYPDVLISKGGYASFPAVLAARIFHIPVIVHESDSVPGRTNIWASHFAERVAVSWHEALRFFPKEKTALTGQPVRKEIMHPIHHGAYEYLKLEEGIPVIFIVGGSQGAQIINETVLDILPQLVSHYSLIHQVGAKNIKDIKNLVPVVLPLNKPNRDRYKPFGFLNALAMRMSAGVSTLVISRASSTIFEIASWGLPSIVIPITDSHGNHQRQNAFNYARGGACVVIEEKNLTPHVLASEIEKLMRDEGVRRKMGHAARKFFRPNAARIIAEEAIRIALKHEE